MEATRLTGIRTRGKELLKLLTLFVAASALACYRADVTSAAISPWPRVRVTRFETSPQGAVHDTALVTGFLISSDSASLLLRNSAGDRRYPRTSVLRVERSRGLDRAKGALIGGFSGLLLGAALGVSADHPCDKPAGYGLDLSRWCDLSRGPTKGGVTGMIGGSLLGFLHGWERWGPPE